MRVEFWSEEYVDADDFPERELVDALLKKGWQHAPANELRYWVETLRDDRPFDTHELRRYLERVWAAVNQ